MEYRTPSILSVLAPVKIMFTVQGGGIIPYRRFFYIVYRGVYIYNTRGMYYTIQGGGAYILEEGEGVNIP